MGKYTDEVRRLRAEFKEKYSPSTAFGNVELLTLQDEIVAAEKILEGHKECEECEGWGTVECGECGHDRACDECVDGLISI